MRVCAKFHYKILFISLQHPAHRLRLAQILDHPFMREQQSSTSQETPLPRSQPSIRGAHPLSQASLDSGQFTMSSSQSVNRSGPMRATVRPHGIENHIPPTTLCSTVSTSTQSSGPSHSRHQSMTSAHASQSNKPTSGHRKTHSVDGLNSKHPFRNHSNSQSSQLLGTKHYSISCEDLRQGNKENTPTQSRKAKSDFDPGRATTHHRTNSTRRPLEERYHVNSAHPFKDRTNVQPKSEEKKTSERRAVESLKELVPPLNAARLRPIKQQTRSAIVSK